MVNTIVMAEINNTTHNEKVVYTNTTEETIEFFNDTNTSLAKITIKKNKMILLLMQQIQKVLLLLLQVNNKKTITLIFLAKLMKIEQ